LKNFSEVSRQRNKSDEKNLWNYDFVIYQKK
jgi:hypothetical protein